MFYNKVGKMALGSRLRMLSETITEDAGHIYELYGIELKPKWFPVFYVLSENQEKSITTIAKEIGHSHPSVSKIVREMCKGGIAYEKKDSNDGRRNLIALTKKGISISVNIKDQYTDVNNAIQMALNRTQHDIWKAIEEFELILKQKNLYERVKEQKKNRVSKHIKIVSYKPKYQEHFKKLNEEWITAYFNMEEADSKALDHPKEHILDTGGHIVVALYKDAPIGVCALLKSNDMEWDFELAKMAVSPNFRGLGIGWLLGNAVIYKARSLGARKIYIESNTALASAIKLYRNLGFEEVSGYPTPYERCNIQMILKLR